MDNSALIIIAVATAVLVGLIGYMVINMFARSNPIIRDAQMVAKMSREMNTPLLEQIDRNAARSRIQDQLIDNLRSELMTRGKSPMTDEEAAIRANVPMAIFDTNEGDDDVDLRRALIDLFDIGELNVLARDAGIDPDELRGETKTERAVALIQRAHRLKLLGALKGLVKKARPNADVHAI